MRSTVSISSNALASIRATIASTSPTLETGGALFGHERSLRITAASGPGPNAIHQAQYFLRDLEYTQDAAKRAFETDRSQWIGEWHTHPHGPPHPSHFDLNTYVNHLIDTELNFERFLALIWVTATPTVSAWLLTRSAEGVELVNAHLTIERDPHRPRGSSPRAH